MSCSFPLLRRLRTSRVARIGALGLLIAVQTACIKGSLDQLASPAAVEDMRTILAKMDLPGNVGALVQEVLNVGRANLDDDAWELLLEQASIAVMEDAAVRVTAHGGELSPAARGRMVNDVRAALMKLARSPSPHDPEVTSAVLAAAILESAGDAVPKDQREALEGELTATNGDGLTRIVAGPAPFVRTLARNFTLGIVDGLAEMDPAPIHRFLEEERAAFGESTEDSLRWFGVSFWTASAALGAGLLVVGIMFWQNLRIRRRNTRTLRFLASVLKSREDDPSMRELLNAVSDPQDPDAARNLSEFYQRHPHLRATPRADSNGRSGPQEKT